MACRRLRRAEQKAHLPGRTAREVAARLANNRTVKNFMVALEQVSFPWEAVWNAGVAVWLGLYLFWGKDAGQ